MTAERQEVIMKVIDIINEMKAKGFTNEANIDLSFKNDNVARGKLSDFFPPKNENALMYAEMSGKLTSYYSIQEMLDMNLIAIDDVG